MRFYTFVRVALDNRRSTVIHILQLFEKHQMKKRKCCVFKYTVERRLSELIWTKGGADDRFFRKIE